MSIIDKILKKKDDSDIEEPSRIPSSLPEDLEQFKLNSPAIEEKPSPFEPREPAELPRPDLQKKEESFLPEDILSRNIVKQPEQKSDRLELILSKLETIDTRLKLIEEKMRK